MTILDVLFPNPELEEKEEIKIRVKVMPFGSIDWKFRCSLEGFRSFSAKPLKNYVGILTKMQKPIEFAGKEPVLIPSNGKASISIKIRAKELTCIKKLVLSIAGKIAYLCTLVFLIIEQVLINKQARISANL